MVARLPQPGGDDGDWGTILNDFLLVAHDNSGAIKSGAIADDTSTQRIAVSKDGAAVGTRQQLNFVTGSNATLAIADNAPGNRVDVTVGADFSAFSDLDAATYGLVAQTIALGQTSTKFVLNSGTCVFMLVRLPSTTVHSLGTWKVTEAVGPTGVNGMALYTLGGTLIDQTVDMTAALTNPVNEWVSGNLSGGARSVPAGSYYVAFLSHMTNGPYLAAASNITDIPPINGYYPSIYLTGQTAFPASFNPAWATLNNGVFYLTVQ